MQHLMLTMKAEGVADASVYLEFIATLPVLPADQQLLVSEPVDRRLR